MVSLMDSLPTASEAAGIEIPNHVEGMSLCGLLKSERETHREHVFCEVNYHAAYEPMRSIRTDRYKYIRRYDKRSRLVLPNVDDTPTKNFLLDQDWGKLPRDQEMLYDLIFDPDETNNIATRADMTETKRDLTNLLNQWMNDTNDPLLPNGHVNAPKGSKVNNSDDLSPKDTPQLIT